MKIKTFMWLAAVVCAGSASAQGLALQPTTAIAGPVASTANSNSTSVANSNSQGGAGYGVGSQGQSLSIDSHAVYQGQERNPVSTAIGPALTSSNDTCMGSTSVGASAVSFGVSVGSTWTDDNCVMLKNAREMWNMGFKGAALARMCMDDLNREAFEVTGINCPARRKDSDSQSTRTAGKADGDVNLNDGYRN